MFRTKHRPFGGKISMFFLSSKRCFVGNQLLEKKIFQKIENFDKKIAYLPTKIFKKLKFFLKNTVEKVCRFCHHIENFDKKITYFLTQNFNFVLKNTPEKKRKKCVGFVRDRQTPKYILKINGSD